MLQLFLKVFGSMKQRVLWKFEDESIDQLPPNVMIRKWLPQADILAHPNVKVFITHCGLFGTQEGVHYAVPMLGMPFYCDQVSDLWRSNRRFVCLRLMSFAASQHEQGCAGWLRH